MNRIDERDFLVVQGYRSIGVQAVAPTYLHYTILHTHTQAIRNEQFLDRQGRGHRRIRDVHTYVHASSTDRTYRCITATRRLEARETVRRGAIQNHQRKFKHTRASAAIGATTYVIRYWTVVG